MSTTVKTILISAVVFLALTALNRLFLDNMLWDKIGTFEEE